MAVRRQGERRHGRLGALVAHALLFGTPCDIHTKEGINDERILSSLLFGLLIAGVGLRQGPIRHDGYDSEYEISRSPPSSEGPAGQSRATPRGVDLDDERTAAHRVAPSGDVPHTRRELRDQIGLGFDRLRHRLARAAARSKSTPSVMRRSVPRRVR